ncbi:sensor histidine kinase [Luteolibacter arcticus]|uniref:histidine kinase n=1 Tax=Luteolibacter arcticus TaxID=1581411 RepID=A0ABT3GN50_9BACT|nr:sensor histidine kinase [Luteolibacter arcticus]MCW1924944.1 sensor histidine kinase [Luteolibacter arcticus]
MTFPSKPWQVVVIGSLALLIIGVIDTRIEPQLGSAFFYMLPVLLVTRHAGTRTSIIFSILATGVSLYADLQTSGPAVPTYVPYWNAALRCGVLMVAVLLLISLRKLNGTLEARVHDRTARLEDEVKNRLKLERRILDAKESEQARIGQDLHDGLCQQLVATAFSAALLQRSLEEKSAPEAADAERIAKSIDESIGQARDIAKGLHPVPLEEEGLETALRDLARSTSKHTGIRCTAEVSGKPSHLDKAASIHLYRIAQEALNNAVKHSAASSIAIRFATFGDDFELAVEDNGHGMIRGTRTNGGGGMGLHIMDYRARAIGAELDISPGKDGGTRVRCVSSPQSTIGR